MTNGRLVKTFDDFKKAEKWARAFDFARAFSRLQPLSVEQTGDAEWSVRNPGNEPPVLRTPVPIRTPIPRD